MSWGNDIYADDCDDTMLNIWRQMIKARTLLLIKDYTKAGRHAKKALNISENIRLKVYGYISCFIIKEIYNAEGKHELAGLADLQINNLLKEPFAGSAKLTEGLRNSA